MLGMITNAIRRLFVVVACVMALLVFGYDPGSTQPRQKITVAFVAPAISLTRRYRILSASKWALADCFPLSDSLSSYHFIQKRKNLW